MRVEIPVSAANPKPLGWLQLILYKLNPSPACFQQRLNKGAPQEAAGLFPTFVPPAEEIAAGWGLRAEPGHIPGRNSRQELQGAVGKQALMDLPDGCSWSLNHPAGSQPKKSL